MKKLALLLVALLFASQAMALTITVTDDGSAVTIGYADANSLDLVRGFALDISVDAGTLGAVTELSTDYYIYPGTIVIDAAGDVTDAGTAVAPEDSPGEKDPGITIEMASLYAATDPCGHTTPPGTSGDLVSIVIDETCNLAIAVNTLRGGIVLESGAAGDAGLPSSTQINRSCYAGMADYAVWEAVGSPDCWCYPRQCHGDADGVKYGSDRNGWYYVGTTDLQILAAGWMVKEDPKGPGIATISYGGVPGACADFDHTKYGSDRNGWYYVGTADLIILANTWMIKEVPKGVGIPGDCLPGNLEP